MNGAETPIKTDLQLALASDGDDVARTGYKTNLWLALVSEGGAASINGVERP
jgi:hypothetical protein